MKRIHLFAILCLLLVPIALFACTEETKLVEVAARPATCEEDGYIGYFYEEATGKYFADAAGTQEISQDSLRIPALGHSYGSWEKHKNPSIFCPGSLVRTCKHNKEHKELYEIPTLDAKNGYTVSDTDGTKTLTAPTFESKGAAFYTIHVANQIFTYRADFPKLSEYYESRDDAIYVPITDATFSGSGASYNAAAETLIVTNNKDTVSLTVRAPKEGFYSLYMKYANKNNLSTMISVYNDSYPEWKGYTKSWLDGSEKYSVMNYTLYERERLGDFPTNECAVVYLKKGDNDLRFVFNRQIGISDMLFVEKLTFDDASELLLFPYNGAQSSANGVKINGNGSTELTVSVAKDGAYDLYAMMSTSGGTLTVDSKSGSFPALTVDCPETQGRTVLPEGDRISATYLRRIGTLQLKAGTHTIRISLALGNSGVNEYFHYNYAALLRIGDMEKSESFSVDLDRLLTPEIHKLTLTANVSGTDPATGSPNMTVVLEGYYTHTDGTETPLMQELQKTAYDQKLVFDTTPLSGNMDGVSYRLKLYNADKSALLHTGRLYHYSTRDTLTVFMITDLHHTGSNLTQEIRNYKYAETHNWGWNERVLKTYNSNSTACDIYGWSTDEKVQRVMDDVIERYEAGEFDIAFFLGDSSMNDGNYYNFASDHMFYTNQSHYGESIDDFWDSPLNLDLLMLEQYFSQLSDAGIPYYTANGNHDYSFDYNETKTDIDYSAREKMYHYQELFGHKDADGYIYDATPTNYMIRVIRRNGEVKVLSALSSEELAAFRQKYDGDANCYDYYVSEDSLTDSDKKLGAFMMVDTYQYESLDYYMNYYVYMKDGETGGVDTSKKDYHGQTIRSDYHNLDVIEEMTPMVEEFSTVYMVSHNHCSDIADYLAEHENIVGWFMGDLHEMSDNNTRFVGLVQQWITGQFACGFDTFYYYERDPNTGASTGVADSQYYYSKNGRIGNVIGGAYENIPFSYGTLHIKGDEAYYAREDISYFYQNTEPQYNIMFDRVVGWDPMYTRAVDLTHESGTSFKIGNRTVFVGGDTFIVGTSYLQIAQSYKRGKYNTPEYMLVPASGSTYTVADLAGRALNASGQPVVISGGSPLTVTLQSTDEGTTLTVFGATYYVISKSGGTVGHYLYDENRDFVYVDKNGNYVFYDFYKDENGDFMLEYFFEDENGNFVPLGYWNADHTKYTLYNGKFTHESGSYVDENGVTQTTAGIWLAGDTMTVSGIDSTTNDADLADKVITQYKNGKFRTDKAELLIQNGVVVRGEGFMHKSYTYRFVDAYGNEIRKDDVLRDKKLTYTYTLKDRAGYTPGDALTQNSFNRQANGETEIYGYYVPHIIYEGDWIHR